MLQISGMIFFSLAALAATVAIWAAFAEDWSAVKRALVRDLGAAPLPVLRPARIRLARRPMTGLPARRAAA